MTELRRGVNPTEAHGFVNPTYSRELWRLQARCADKPTGTFFPDDSQRDHARTVIAAYCARCPVESECLDYALRLRIDFGIYGGTTPPQRRRILQLRRRLA